MTLAAPRTKSGDPSPSATARWADFASPPGTPAESGDLGVARRPIRRFMVTGVLVLHDGAPWLTQCLDALALQTRPLDRLVIVDTGSLDESLDIAVSHGRIREVVRDVRVTSAPRESVFGAAVRLAVDELSSALRPQEARHEWLWLLHDDSVADPQTLAQLLDAVRRSPSVGVAGPKLTTWDDPSRLLEVGQQITRSGSRAGGPAKGEPDQGQHDHRSDVLAVNTSGMLIQRDVFDAIGGFDPDFGQFGDDLDLCWRAQLAGHRVVIVPRARIREAAASANGHRVPELSASGARRRDRRHVRQVALARCSLWASPFLAVWIVVASVVSALVLLIFKRPRRAWEDLGDLGSLITPWRPLAARWRARGTRRLRRRDLHGLFVSPGSGFRHAIDAIHDAVAFDTTTSTQSSDGDTRAMETGPASADMQSLDRQRVGVTARILGHPGFLVVMVAILLSVATWRSLLGPLISNGLGVSGGELLPVSTDASGLWHSWLDGWHGAGLGNAIEAPPYLPLLAAGAWFLEHLPLIGAPASSVGSLIGWLLAAAIPLSAWTAYLGARVATRAPWPRAWAALAWASLGTLAAAQSEGRLGSVVAHILLPLVVAGFFCVARRFASVSVTFGTATALAVTGTFNPMLAVLGALTALGLLAFGHGATRLRAGVLLLVPVGLLGPWILRLAEHPLLLLAGPGLTQWHAGAGLTIQDKLAATVKLALLHPGGPGAFPAYLSAPIVLAGVVAMMRREGAGISRAMTALGALTLTGLAVAVASSHVTIGLTPGADHLAGAGGPITIWAGTGLDLAALALIAAAVLGLDGLKSRLARSGFGWRQALLVPVLAAAVVGVVASAATAGWIGASHVLVAQAPSMPAVAADQAGPPLASRLLLLAKAPGTSASATIDYRLIGIEPGAVARDLPVAADAADPLLAATVGQTVGVAARPSADAAQQGLGDLAIGFVAFRGAGTDPLVRRLDATAGLTRLSDSRGLILWRVQPRARTAPSSRLRVDNGAGAPLQPVAVGGPHAQSVTTIAAANARSSTLGRRLVAAESPGWAEHARVTFAGRDLAAVAGGGQPTYPLPLSAGPLTVTVEPTDQAWRWGQLALLLVVLFLAAPFGSSRARRVS